MKQDWLSRKQSKCANSVWSALDISSIAYQHRKRAGGLFSYIRSFSITDRLVHLLIVTTILLTLANTAPSFLASIFVLHAPEAVENAHRA